MIWAEFEGAAPSLALIGHERFMATRVALLGTLRRDGSPRISPVEPVFAAGHLLFGVMRSAKSADLARDQRCTLHSSVFDPNGSEGEFKLFGRAFLVEDSRLRDSGDGWWKSYPAEASAVYSMDIESASFVAWNFEAMTFQLTQWSPSTGVKQTTTAYP